MLELFIYVEMLFYIGLIKHIACGASFSMAVALISTILQGRNVINFTRLVLVVLLSKIYL
jgi:hypothetical protein